MMKFFTLILIILSYNISFAVEKQTGTIHTKKGELLDVKIKVYEYGILLSSNKIVYYENEKKKKIHLNDIKKVVLNSKTYEVITFQKTTTTGPNRGVKTFKLLTELIVDGNIKLYRKYQVESNGYMANGIYMAAGNRLTERNFFVKGSDFARLVTRLDFKKKVNMFFPDCNLLIEKNGQKMKYKNIDQVVLKGNKECN